MGGPKTSKPLPAFLEQKMIGRAHTTKVISQKEQAQERKSESQLAHVMHEEKENMTPRCTMQGQASVASADQKMSETGGLTMYVLEGFCSLPIPEVPLLR
jgi:hypothetical protein